MEKQEVTEDEAMLFHEIIKLDADLKTAAQKLFDQKKEIEHYAEVVEGIRTTSSRILLRLKKLDKLQQKQHG